MQKLFTIIYFSNIFCIFVNASPINDNVIADDDQPGRTALYNFPLIDGHNDLAHNLLIYLENQINNFDFNNDLKKHPVLGITPRSHTDLLRIKQGKLGAQFWVAYVKCDTQFRNAVPKTLEQIDVIKRLVQKYSDHMQFVTSADGILDAFRNKKLASLIGVEGGHSIGSSFSILRLYYELGVRYLTLTHVCNTPWADSSLADAYNNTVSNLTNFGKDIVLEMNRLGMLVDLSHVSYNVMAEAIYVSKAPVIFSHSSAYGVYPHHRNVKDDILEKVKNNKGIVMVNFFPIFIGNGNVTIRDVVDHINHIVDVAGIDHVGIGSDFDGVVRVPDGLEDVSKYPDLFDLLKELNPKRWTISNLEKLAGRNFIRVFKEAEKVRDSFRRELPDEGRLSRNYLQALINKTNQCI